MHRPNHKLKTTLGYRKKMALVLLCTFLCSLYGPAPLSVAQEPFPEENVRSLGKLQEVVQRSAEQKALLDNQVGPGLLKAVKGREMTPWSDSALHTYLPRTRIVAGQVVKMLNDNVLATLLTENNPPSHIPDNPYVKLTKQGGVNSLEQRLYNSLREHRGVITPQDVLAQALDICDNDYWLATLTAHNFLKEVTYASRMGETPLFNDIPPADWDAQYRREIGEIRSDLPEFIQRFQQLRVEGDRFLHDRMGPWYHSFGLFFVGGITSGTEAQILADLENFSRMLRVGSRPDLGKENVNSWAGRTSVELNQAVAEARQRKAAERPSLPQAVAEILDGADGKLTRGTPMGGVVLQPGNLVMQESGEWVSAYGGWREEEYPPNLPKKAGPFYVQPGKYRAHLYYAPDIFPHMTAGNSNTGMAVNFVFKGLTGEAQGSRVVSIRPIARDKAYGEAEQEFVVNRPGAVYVVFTQAACRGQAGGYYEPPQSYRGKIEFLEALPQEAVEFGMVVMEGDVFQAGRHDATIGLAGGTMVRVRAGSEIRMELTAAGTPRLVVLRGGGRFITRGSDFGRIEVVTSDGKHLLQPQGTDFIVSDAAVEVVAGEVEVLAESHTALVQAGERFTFKDGQTTAFEVDRAGPATSADGIPLASEYWDPSPEPYGAKSALFRADTVGDGWLLADPPARWNLSSPMPRVGVETPLPGVLRLGVPRGSRLDDQGNTAPRLLHKVTGDFDLETQVWIEGSDGRVQFLVRTPGTYTGAQSGQFPKTLVDGPGQHYWLGGVGLASASDGRTRLPALNETTASRWLEVSEGPVYLRLARRGNVWTSAWSLDGATWQMNSLALVEMPETLWVGMLFGNTGGMSNLVTYTLSNVRLETAPPGTLERPPWNTYAINGQVAIQEDTVRLTLDGDTPGNARALLGEYLEGDFEIEVAFDASAVESQPGAVSRWTLGLVAPTERGLAVGCEVTAAGQRCGVVYQTADYYYHRTSMAYGPGVLQQAQGKLRLVRQGDVIFAYYGGGEAGNDFQEVKYYRRDEGGFDGPLFVRLEVSNEQTDKEFAAVDVTFSVQALHRSLAGRLSAEGDDLLLAGRFADALARYQASLRYQGDPGLAAWIEQLADYIAAQEAARLQSGWWLWLALAVVVVAVVSGGAALLLRRRRPAAAKEVSRPAAAATTGACPACGRALSSTARFCMSCGVAVSQAPATHAQDHCLNCGQPTRPGAVFCQDCGQKIARQ